MSGSGKRYRVEVPIDGTYVALFGRDFDSREAAHKWGRQVSIEPFYLVVEVEVEVPIEPLTVPHCRECGFEARIGVSYTVSASMDVDRIDLEDGTIWADSTTESMDAWPSGPWSSGAGDSEAELYCRECGQTIDSSGWKIDYL